MSYDADRYEEALFYETGAHSNFITQKTLARIKAALPELDQNREELRMLDIGAGTGNFTLNIANALNISPANCICVEPQTEFGPHILKKGMIWEHLDAVKFCRNSNPDHGGVTVGRKFDVILLKESIHFVNKPNRPVVFETLKLLLRPPVKGRAGGVCLVLCRPAKTQLPFFEAAKLHYSKQTPSISQLHQSLAAAGFKPHDKIETNTITSATDTATSSRSSASAAAATAVKKTQKFEYTYSTLEEEVPCEVTPMKWFQMLRTRFWSTLFLFTDTEIESGIEELHTGCFAGKAVIEFKDVYVFLVLQAQEADHPNNRNNADNLDTCNRNNPKNRLPSPLTLG